MTSPGQFPGQGGQQFPGQGGQPFPGQGVVGAPPDNYLVWGILSTLFCCLPLGIVSIVYSTKVNNLFHAGDHAGAMAASENAKKWAIISAAVSAVLVVLWILFVVVVGIGAEAADPQF